MTSYMTQSPVVVEPGEEDGGVPVPVGGHPVTIGPHDFRLVPVDEFVQLRQDLSLFDIQCNQ